VLTVHDGRENRHCVVKMPLDRPRRTWLNLVFLMLSHFHLYGELRFPGVMGQRNRPSGLLEDDDDDDDDVIRISYLEYLQ